MKYEEKNVVKALFFAAKNIRVLLANMLREFDIGFEQAGILSVVKKNKMSSINEIAAIFDKDKGTISRAMKTLEAKGLISRIHQDGDKRVVYIELTELGRKKVEIIEKVMQEINEQKIDKALQDEEKKAFLKTLNKILEAFYE
ncbi:MarR family winged helix-turn-helix transcriptional regulator [Helicobacter anatolicus]|uniref:MarR family winged helix-turn-helix transcriptional regulator n=1 Tax=Helicobacter anatolicus TaxID=2905874 RepID=UPI001E2D7F68|nr:MarR family transcriptional regulator [Helicobacter anatolicus]MCE3039474.1 MarR family transcriptional regulator [Helicobacter anatolicus]